MLSNIQQAGRVIRGSQEILIVTHGDLKGDAMASAMSLYSILKKLGKRASVVSRTSAPNNLQFLPHIDTVTQSLPKANDFVISLNLSKAKVDQLSYKVEGNKLNILITPKDDGKFNEKDLESHVGKSNYDLIVTINTNDLEHLGSIYANNAELFYGTPILNIDHDPANEAYGKINVVDIKAAATSQIVYAIAKDIETTNKGTIDEDLATSLLAGIIAETESFQTYSTTPEVFKTASELYDKGADQQTIIRYLYKTKSLASLNLWGRVLARLKQSSDQKLVWSMLSQDDFQKSEASHLDIEGVMKELLSAMPGAEILLVLYERDKKVYGKIHAPHNIDAIKVAGVFQNATGHFDNADFTTEYKTLNEAEYPVTDKLRKSLGSGA